MVIGPTSYLDEINQIVLDTRKEAPSVIDTLCRKTSDRVPNLVFHEIILCAEEERTKRSLSS